MANKPVEMHSYKKREKNSSVNLTDSDSDWNFIDDEFEDEEKKLEQFYIEPNKTKKKPFLDFMLSAKSKIYNLYKSYPREPAHFNIKSPIWLLGKCYVLKKNNLRDSLSMSASNIGHKNSSSSSSNMNDLEYSNYVHCSDELCSDLVNDFQSQLWFTYRSHFSTLQNSDITSDMGWGCMVRTGQMMIAHAFIKRFLGRSWRYNGDHNDPCSGLQSQIISWFLDKPGPLYPYSIHNIVKIATKYNTAVGTWFEPSKISLVLKLLVRSHSPGSITMYVAKEPVVYKTNVYRLMQTETHTIPSPKPTKRNVNENNNENDNNKKTKNNNNNNKNNKNNNNTPSLKPNNNNNNNNNNDDYDVEDDEDNNNERVDDVVEVEEDDVDLSHESIYKNNNIDKDGFFRPIIIVIPIRLGLSKINEDYIPQLKEFFQMPQSIGIIGGKPNSSLYFIGTQDDYVLYLDPHHVHQAVEVNQRGEFDLETFHCQDPYKMPYKELDPSMAIGFFCQNKKDFDNFYVRIKEQMVKYDLMSIFSVESLNPNEEEYLNNCSTSESSVVNL